MAETTSRKGSKQKKKKAGKKIELSIRDLKFIQAVDYILDKNREVGEKPDTDNALGAKIYPSNRSIITAVRSASRHIPELALTNLAQMYEIDMNFFYRDGAPLRYKPKKEKATVSAKDNKGIVSTGEKAINTLLEGDSRAEVIGIMKGNIYKGNNIGEVIQKADKIINNKFEPDKKEMCQELLGTIQKETNNMENIIHKKMEDIKKMQKLYEDQVRTERLKVEGLEKELNLSRESEREILKKYTTLLEKGSK